MENSRELVVFQKPQINQVQSMLGTRYQPVSVPQEKVVSLTGLVFNTSRWLQAKKIKEENFFPIFHKEISALLEMGPASAGGLVYTELARFGADFTKCMIRSEN